MYFKVVVINYSLILKVNIYVLIIWSINSNISTKIFQSSGLTRLLYNKYSMKRRGCYISHPFND